MIVRFVRAMSRLFGRIRRSRFSCLASLAVVGVIVTAPRSARGESADSGRAAKANEAASPLRTNLAFNQIDDKSRLAFVASHVEQIAFKFEGLKADADALVTTFDTNRGAHKSADRVEVTSESLLTAACALKHQIETDPDIQFDSLGFLDTEYDRIGRNSLEVIGGGLSFDSAGVDLAAAEITGAAQGYGASAKLQLVGRPLEKEVPRVVHSLITGLNAIDRVAIFLNRDPLNTESNREHLNDLIMDVDAVQLPQTFLCSISRSRFRREYTDLRVAFVLDSERIDGLGQSLSTGFAVSKLMPLGADGRPALFAIANFTLDNVTTPGSGFVRSVGSALSIGIQDRVQGVLTNCKQCTYVKWRSQTGLEFAPGSAALPGNTYGAFVRYRVASSLIVNLEGGVSGGVAFGGLKLELFGGFH